MHYNSSGDGLKDVLNISIDTLKKRMKIIKTILSESLEIALKSNSLKGTDPYNMKPLFMTDPYTPIWPIRTTVVTNIAGFVWRLWNDYTRDYVDEHVLFAKTYQ